MKLCQMCGTALAFGGVYCKPCSIIDAVRARDDLTFYECKRAYKPGDMVALDGSENIFSVAGIHVLIKRDSINGQSKRIRGYSWRVLVSDGSESRFSEKTLDKGEWCPK